MKNQIIRFKNKTYKEKLKRNHIDIGISEINIVKRTNLIHLKSNQFSRDVN